MMIHDCCSSGTLDGGLGLLLPMTEKTYRRLHMLQTKLVECIPHVAGLNPKAFRSVDILTLVVLVLYHGIQKDNKHRNTLVFLSLLRCLRPAIVHLNALEVSSRRVNTS